MSNYTDTQFRSFFQGDFDEECWMDMLRNLFQVEHLRLEKETILTTENAFFYGSTTTSDHYSIGFFRYDIDAENIARRRVSLRQLVKPFINERWGQFDGAIVVYTARKDWRISFICDLSNEKTNPKRFTFLLGDPKCQYNTAVGRFKGLQDKGISFGTIRDAFSVEQLTKDFYNELYKWYEWATDKESKDKTPVTFPSNVEIITDDQNDIEEKVIRLITRIMFVWFIKQKQLVPDNLFDAQEVQKVLKDFDQNSTTNGNYYNAILQNLFFATLNCEPSCRRFAHTQAKDIKTRYRYAEMFRVTEEEVVEMFSTIPYLNGGLFECLDKTAKIDGEPDVFYDGFSNNATCFRGTDRPKYRAVVPNCVFFDDNRGLLPILKKYNFTIEENSTDDQTIALDPELLGKVFENLLAVYNPETKESARKESGSFYTPREIVDYMCKEAVIAYLGEESRDFVEKRKIGNLESQDLLQKLKKIKIFDPACGSGAFPMGLLNLLDSLIETLEPTANRYERKLQIIQNSIYGADIQCIAVQITKLRFFISLVCDAGDNIQPLPNLETKFVSANSLIDLQSENKQLSLFNVDDLKQQLFDVRAKHFATRSVSEKIKLREQDEHLRNQLLEKLTSNVNDDQAQQMAHWDPYDQNNSAEFFNPSWMFGVDNFDIIIGNPPYVQLQKNGGKLGDLYKDKGYKAFNSMGDIYCLFYERALQLLCANGHLCFITSNKWMRAGYGQALRQLLSENNPKLLIDFAGQKIFENATVDVNILLLQKMVKRENGNFRTLSAMAKSKDFKMLNFTPMTFSSDSWVIMNATEQNIKQKIESVGTPLKDWNIEIFRGVLTGYNDAFIIDDQTRCQILNNCTTPDERERTERLIVKILRGRDIKRYSYDWQHLWLINTHNGVKGEIDRIHIEDYPAVKAHLDNYYSKLAKRTDKGETPYNLRNCAYLSAFSKEKIVYPETTQGSRFVYDDAGMYIDKTCFMMVGSNLKYVIGILSSRLIDYVFRFSFQKLGGKGIEMAKIYMDTLPLPLPSTNPEIAKQIEKLVQQRLRGDISAEQHIDNLVYQLYGLSNEEIEYIEGNA